ncbi:MAG: hypothetical protein LBF38_01540 [Deltaproteobacteria bacterium]|jgi:hypothetical protein|nr:hypothetical protein [Deltaproteobacteria bacterium]
MKSKQPKAVSQKPTVVVKPGFKLILLMILTLILLQFVTLPTRDQSQVEPSEFGEISSERQAKCPTLEGFDALNGDQAVN